MLWLVSWPLGSAFPATIAEDQRNYPYGVNTSFGYSVQKHRWRRNGLRINLWAGSSLTMTFDVPGLELARVKTQRWLAKDRAILIELDYVYHDSIESRGELALLYDFERGELHSFGSPSAWFVWEPESMPSRKATREEFDEVVAKLSAPPHGL